MATEGRRRSGRSTLSFLLVMIGVWALSVSTAMETCPQCACSELTVEQTTALDVTTTEGGNASFSCRRNNSSFQDEWYVHTRDSRSLRVGSTLFRATLTHLEYALSQSPGEESLTFSLTLRNVSLLENGLLVTCESVHISNDGVCSFYPRRPFTLSVLPLAESEDCETTLEMCGNNLTACEVIKMEIENDTRECEEEIRKCEEARNMSDMQRRVIENISRVCNESLERERELKENITQSCERDKISLEVARQVSENNTRVCNESRESCEESRELCEENVTVVIAVLIPFVIVNVALLIAVSVALCYKLRPPHSRYDITTPTATELDNSVKIITNDNAQ